MELNSISYENAVADLEAHPNKRLFWRSGFAWKGAVEREISRDPKDYPYMMPTNRIHKPFHIKIESWKDKLKLKYDWACVVELGSNTDVEMHLNGLSGNDMF